MTTLFVVALPAEARPLIQHYSLQAIPGLPWRLYQQGEVALVISGVGKVAAASAVSFSYAWLGCPEAFSAINFGIAAHSEGELELPYYVSCATDVAAEKSYHPWLHSSLPCATAQLYTVDTVERDFSTPGLYDMEGAGFFAAALRYTGVEFVQSIKLVSDTAESGIDHVTVNFVDALIQKHLPLVDQLLTLQEDLQEKETSSPLYEAIVEEKHTSQTIRNKLKQLCRRWDVCFSGEELPWRSCRSGKEVVRLFEERLSEYQLEVE